MWGAGFDTMTIPHLGIEGSYRVLIRIVGTEQDFRSRHRLTLTLRDPNLEVLGTLERAIDPRAPGRNHIAGYEINHHLRVDIEMPLDTAGGYALTLGLDGQPDHRHTIVISVIERS
jgi:hypothetical protein